MSGAVKNSMYALRPVFNLPELNLPKNMYTLRSLEAVGENNHHPEVLRQIQDKSKGGDCEDLERRWDLVLEQLAELKKQLADIKNLVGTSHIISNTRTDKSSASVDPEVLRNLQMLDGAVVNASPSDPPYSLLALRLLLAPHVHVIIRCHTHSSTPPPPPDLLRLFTTSPLMSSNTPVITIILIWRLGMLDVELVPGLTRPLKHSSILGDVNIIRYVARLSTPCLQYDEADDTSLLVDQVLDTCHRLAHVRTQKEKQALTRGLNARLGKSVFFGGTMISLMDAAVWAVLQKNSSLEDLPANLTKWLTRVPF